MHMGEVGGAMDQQNINGTFFSLDPGTVLGTFFRSRSEENKNVWLTDGSRGSGNMLVHRSRPLISAVETIAATNRSRTASRIQKSPAQPYSLHAFVLRL